MGKKTALFEEHKKQGARLIDFGGWDLPVQYTSVIEEHLACRQAAGLFDVSHMGEITVCGKEAPGFLDFLLTNWASKLQPGQAQYNAMCLPSGGTIDDLVIYRRAPDQYLLVVNASNTDKDFAWITEQLAKYRERHPQCDVTATNDSLHYTQLALQGRKAAEILQPLTSVPLQTLKPYWFAEGLLLGTHPAIIARTGYTGEDGFELYLPWDAGAEVWNALLRQGAPLGLKPCGLGARDTLRLEMKYALYGHELSETITPLEAGLGWITKLEKPDFIGKAALLQAKETGIQRQLVGLKLTERAVARQGHSVFFAGTGQTGTWQKIGEVTSGTFSPSLQTAIAIALVDRQHSAIGTHLWIEIRGKYIPAEVVPTPFYRRDY